jgi:hypothetical protein
VFERLAGSIEEPTNQKKGVSLMSSRNPFLVLSLSVVAVAASACQSAGEPDPSFSCPVASPLKSGETPALTPPQGAELYLSLYAEGSQIYTCKAGTDGAYAWVFKAPEATLYDETCAQVGTHFAGPTWQMNGDGSAVTGMKLAEAPMAGAIPMLLLGATPKSPQGQLGSASYIQRIATTGGLPPSEPCSAADAGRETGTFYTATYLFFR